MVCAVEVEIGEERRMFEIGIVFGVGLEGGVVLPVDEKFEALAVGKDGGVLAGAARGLRSKIPIEIRLDNDVGFGIALRQIKCRTEFGNAENVDHARIFDAMVSIHEAAVFKA